MSLVLNTNINSLVAQNNLNSSQAGLSQALTRLSSGLRINSAADDAAGNAIAQQFTTQINGTNQAINNANDAVSESQTAAGALGTIVNNLQSIRTLAVEAANGSQSASSRAALDQQVQQQIQEITQIAQQTSFNGLNVLNGSAGAQTYQVGANIGNTISINLSTGVAASQVGDYSSATSGAVTATALSSTETVKLSDGASTVTVGPTSNYVGSTAYQSADSAYAKAAAVNAAGLTGLYASATTSVADSAAFTDLTATLGGTYSIGINGQTISVNVGAGGTVHGDQFAAAINQYTGVTGVTASIDTNGILNLNNSDGSNIVLTAPTATGDVAGGVATLAAGTNRGKLTLTDTKTVTITDTGANAGGSVALGFVSGNGTAAAGTSLGAQNVLTVAGANNTITSVDSALATVAAFQAQLGAIQNRFTSAVNNLTATAQNLTQSRSTLQDANFASETANLTKNQVLEQAGISVLAQANSQSQLILKLLP